MKQQYRHFNKNFYKELAERNGRIINILEDGSESIFQSYITLEEKYGFVSINLNEDTLREFFYFTNNYPTSYLTPLDTGKWYYEMKELNHDTYEYEIIRKEFPINTTKKKYLLLVGYCNSSCEEYKTRTEYLKDNADQNLCLECAKLVLKEVLNKKNKLPSLTIKKELKEILHLYKSTPVLIPKNKLGSYCDTLIDLKIIEE